MLINLFDKGKGIEYLQAVYHLSNQQVNSLKDSLYCFYESEQISEAEADEQIKVMWSWLPEKEKQELKNSIMTPTPSRWEPKEDAVELFLKITGVQPDKYDLQDLRFQCIHVSPAIDGGESIKKYGLRKLTDLLENESPIKTFLSEYGIEVKPSERWYSINGVKHSTDDTQLGIKLFATKSEIEALIDGEMDTLKDYSCVEFNPEFLRELPSPSGVDLQSEWKRRRNALLYVFFDVSFDECANIGEMFHWKEPDNYERLLPYLSTKYPFGKEPISVSRNAWLIDSCINNACPDIIIDRIPMAVKEDIAIGPDRISIKHINDFPHG